MLKLPKPIANNKKNEILCKCRPICKSRRRMWKGEVQNTSAELLLERKPIHECFRRWPTIRPITPKSHDAPSVVHICKAPVEKSIDTPYLNYSKLAKKLGAWDAVKSRCPFCRCCKFCGCWSRNYILTEHHDDDRRHDMREFDTRVKHNYQEMQIMYKNF